MISPCPHRAKRIDGLYPKRKPNEMPMVAFTCLICGTSTGMEWRDARKDQQDEALVLGTPGMYRACGAL